jgi:hypothetical protein
MCSAVSAITILQTLLFKHLFSKIVPQAPLFKHSLRKGVLLRGYFEDSIIGALIRGFYQLK